VTTFIDRESWVLSSKSRIRTVQTVQHIRILREELRVDFGDDLDATTFSRLAFEALLANGATTYSVKSFLRDTSLNLSEANNFESLVSHPWAANLSREAYDDFLEVLKQSVTIGVVIPAEIETTLPMLKFRIGEIFPQGEAQSALLRIYQALWEGLKACRLTRISPKLARQFLEEVYELHRTHEPAATLISDLCRHTWLIPTTKSSAAFAYSPQWSRRNEQAASNTAVCVATTLDRELFIKILGAISHTDFSDLVASAALQFIEAIRSSRQEQGAWIEGLILWLGCISHTALLKPKTRDALSHLYGKLSTELPLPILLPIFRSLSDLRICHILLDLRIPGLIEADGPTRGLLRKRFQSQLVANALSESDETASFAALVTAVQQTMKPHARIPMVEIFELVYDLYGSKIFHRFLKRCLDTNVVIYPDAVSTILKRTVVEDDPHLAHAIWRMRKVWINQCPELPLSLIQKTSTHSERIFRMLSHRDPSNSVPYSRRTSRRNPLSQSRVDLVHRIALSFAQRKSKSSRVALRDVYQCYIYLSSRRAPLHPAMSRALVLSGILRPLNENRYVSAGLVTWIMKVVERVEGKEVSEKLETIIYRWRARIRRQLQVEGEWKDNKEDIPKPTGASGVWLPHRKSGVSVNEYKYLPKWYKQAVENLDNGTSSTQSFDLVEQKHDESQRILAGSNERAVQTENAERLKIQRAQSTRGVERSQIKPFDSSPSRREWAWNLKVLIQGEVERKEDRAAQEHAEGQR